MFYLYVYKSSFLSLTDAIFDGEQFVLTRMITEHTWAILWRCLRDPRFSCDGITPTCDALTDRHMVTAYTALA